MAPINGTAGKPAKPAARPLHRPVVPVLPLNYPQRPAGKQATAPAVPSSSPNKAQIATRPAEEKTGSHVPKEGNGQVNGNTTGHGPSSKSGLDAATPSAAPTQAATRTEPVAPVTTPGEYDKGMRHLPSPFQFAFALGPLASFLWPRPSPRRPSFRLSPRTASTLAGGNVG